MNCFLVGLPVPLQVGLISTLISAGVALLIQWFLYLHTTKPMLVLVRRPTRTWTIKNIGTGAALHIYLRSINADGQQKQDFIIYPMRAGDEVKLEKLKYRDTIELYFTNWTGKRCYKTTCRWWEQDVERLWFGWGRQEFINATDESRLHPDPEVPPVTS
jgi:hypothetical protein